MSSEDRPFGVRLRALRRAARLTQQELAERSGVGASTVSDLERGVWHAPRGDTARMLADALGLVGDDRDDFLGIVRDQRQPSRRIASAPVPPPPRTHPLVGRDTLLADLSRLLAPGAFVTLVGTGGVGKTRLALEHVHLAATDRAGPVVWVDLAAVSSPADLLPAIARAAGVTERLNAPIRATLVDALRNRAALIVLDNMEQLVAGAPEVVALHAALPDATVLVTSRLPLRVARERPIAVPPLALPPEDAPTDALAAAPAVRLFLDRAADRGHDQPPTPEELREAAGVVTLVDGLPLAIEFAAARTDALSFAMIAELLRHAGSRLLEGGPPEAHDRLRSIERTVAWSYDLLPPAAQRLLRLLAVFRGGFTIAAAAEMAAACGSPGLIAELPALQHASLACQLPVADAGPRLGMLEPTRMVAEQLLAEAGEAGRVRDAHAAVFAGIAREAAAMIPGPRFAEGLAIFDAERANMTAALSRAIGTRDTRLATGLAASLAWWWELRSAVGEGRRWLDQVLALDGGDADLADRLTLRWLALVAASYQEDVADQRRHVAALVAIAEETRDPRARGMAKLCEGFVTAQLALGTPEAIRLFDEAIDLLAPLGPSVELAYALGQRSWEHRLAGATEAALDDIERSIGVWESFGNVVFGAAPHHQHGSTLLALGREGEARAAFRRALAITEKVGSETAAILVVTALAHVAARTDDPEEARVAARLLGAADRIVERRGLSYGTALDARNAETRTLLRDRLGDAGLAALEAEGGAMPTPDAMRLAATL